LSGNMTSSQMADVKISANESAASTTLSLTVTGQSGDTGFCNMTIPKTAVPYGSAPTILIDNQPAVNQGYTQDTDNYYVWYTTHFSTHHVSIVFSSSTSSPTPPSGPSQGLGWMQLAVVGVLVAVVASALVAALAFRRKKG